MAGHPTELKDIYTQILESGSDHWHPIPIGHGEGPSYLTDFETEDFEQQKNPTTGTRTHTTLYILKSNVDIKIAYGIDPTESWFEAKQETTEPPYFFEQQGWASASPRILDIFFRGSLISRHPYYVIENGEAYIPRPNLGAAISFNQFDVDLFDLVNEWESARSWPHYFDALEYPTIPG